MIKINGLKEPPKWYRYVEPGEEPDPRALILIHGSWFDRTPNNPPYTEDNVYAVPIYGPIPDGYELVEDGEWSEGMMYWDYAVHWVPSISKRAKDLYDKVPYIRPIKPTPTERPLLTAADFMKGGPWWIRGSDNKARMITMIFETRVYLDGIYMSGQNLRAQGYQRSNDGEHWEDC